MFNPGRNSAVTIPEKLWIANGLDSGDGGAGGWMDVAAMMNSMKNDMQNMAGEFAALKTDNAGLKADNARLTTRVDDLEAAASGGGIVSSRDLNAVKADLETLTNDTAQINATLTTTLSHVVYGDEFHPGGLLDFTPGSTSLGVLQKTLPGTRLFLTTVTLKGFNFKASVFNELFKDVVTFGGILYANGISFADGNSDLVFTSLTGAQSIHMDSASYSSISFPKLEFVAEKIELQSNSKLKSISIPKLKQVGNYAYFQSNPLLTELNLQSLVFVGFHFYMNNNPLLATNRVQVSKDFSECGGSFAAQGSGLKCTEDNGLKAVAAASKAPSPSNPPSCK